MDARFALRPQRQKEAKNPLKMRRFKVSLRSIFGRTGRLGRIFLTGGLLVACLFLAVAGILYLRVDNRSQSDGARRADVIVILGCQVWPGERPSPALAARTQHGINLYKEGYAPRLLLTGGVGTYPPAEAEVMRRMAVAAGVPSSALVIDDTAHSTEESMQTLRQLMDAQGWKTALIVSDPFHILRSETMATDLAIKAYGSPASNSPTWTVPHLRVYYTAREALALIWYYGEHALGRPTWLYQLLKGRV